MRRGALLALALICGAGSAQALTPVAQDRHVYGQHEFDFGGGAGLTLDETVSAPDYGPFAAESNGAPPTSPPPFPPYNGPTIVTQDSSIHADALHASGTSLGNPANPISAGHRVESESVYSVDFTIDAAGPYTLTGQLDLALVQCVGGTAGLIRLTGPSGVLAEVAGGGLLFSQPISATLALDPGSYTLEARVWTEALGADGPGPGVLCEGSATASFEVDFGPTPAVVPALPRALAPVLAFALAWSARRKR